MHIYFLFWLNLLVGSNLIRKFNELQYSQNFSERNQNLFENSCISFPYQLKVIMEQALFFLNLKLSNLEALFVALIGINFCLLISLYLGRIVCLNLSLVKIKTYNFLLSFDSFQVTIQHATIVVHENYWNNFKSSPRLLYFYVILK